MYCTRVPTSRLSLHVTLVSSLKIVDEKCCISTREVLQDVMRATSDNGRSFLDETTREKKDKGGKKLRDKGGEERKRPRGDHHRGDARMVLRERESVG